MKPKRGLKLTIKQVTDEEVIFQSEPADVTCRPGEHDCDPEDTIHDGAHAGMHLEIRRCRFCQDEYETYAECEGCFED